MYFKNINNYENTVVCDNNLYVGTVSKLYDKKEFYEKTLQTIKCDDKNITNFKMTLKLLNHIKNSNKEFYYIVLRKILFTKDQDTAYDLLYETPGYKMIDSSSIIDNDLKNKIIVNNVINIKSLIEEFGYESYLNVNDIKSIYKFFLKSNSKLFKTNYPSLSIKFEQFIKLRKISHYTRKPNEEEIINSNKLKEKIKVYSFK